jgi:hypothetical protein
MIRKKTVLIVGAGGSIPYGLPSGGDLLSSIVGRLESPILYSAIYRLTGKDQSQVEGVRTRLTRSMTDSIDAFLEKNPDDSFVQDLGKIAIGFCLWSKLQGANAFRALPKEDWIGFVWNKMHQETRSFDDLRANAVTFITFNFDTLLEAKLSDAIVALYPNVHYQDARAYVNSAVIHVHGTLSEPSNQPEPSDEWLRKAIDDIQVVHQEIDKSLLDSLSQFIHDAEIVAFLGFGYHPDNLRKLGFPRNKADMFGSAFGLGDGEKQQVTRAVGTGYGRFTLGAWDHGCKQFLQNHDVLRS